MRFLILGGGIAAVQCVEELARLCPLDLITLVSPTSHLKVDYTEDLKKRSGWKCNTLT